MFNPGTARWDAPQHNVDGKTAAFCNIIGEVRDLKVLRCKVAGPRRFPKSRSRE
jgi:hypothetical protein